MQSIPISLLIQILEQYFLRRSGKRPMTGDFDLATHKLLTTNLSIKEESADWLALRNRVDSAYKNLRVNKFRTESAVGLGCEPELGEPYSRTFLKVECPSGYYYPMTGFATRDNNYVYFTLGNRGVASLASGINYTFQLKSTYGMRNAIAWQLNWIDYFDATRTTDYKILVSEDGALVNGLRFIGSKMYIGKWEYALYTQPGALKTDVEFDAGGFKVAGLQGADGEFQSADGKTVTVTRGLITSIV